MSNPFHCLETLETGKLHWLATFDSSFPCLTGSGEPGPPDPPAGSQHSPTNTILHQEYLGQPAPVHNLHFIIWRLVNIKTRTGKSIWFSLLAKCQKPPRCSVQNMKSFIAVGVCASCVLTRSAHRVEVSKPQNAKNQRFKFSGAERGDRLLCVGHPARIVATTIW